MKKKSCKNARILCKIRHTHNTFVGTSQYFYNRGGQVQAYLLGLLAKIKCSICSYQCENWYPVKRLAILTIIFLGSEGSFSLLKPFAKLPWTYTPSKCGKPIFLK